MLRLINFINKNHYDVIGQASKTSCIMWAVIEEAGLQDVVMTYCAKMLISVMKSLGSCFAGESIHGNRASV